MERNMNILTFGKSHYYNTKNAKFPQKSMCALLFLCILIVDSANAASRKGPEDLFKMEREAEGKSRVRRGLEEFYIDDLFWLLGAGDDDMLSIKNLTSLLVKIGLEEMTHAHDHGHHGHDHDDHSGHDHHDHDDHSGHDHHDHDDHSGHDHHDHDDHGGHDHHDHDDHSGHGHHDHDGHSGHDDHDGHSGHDHHGHDHDDHSGHDHHNHKRSAPDEHTSQDNSSNECVSLKELLGEFGYDSSGLSKDQFGNLCPAFVHQLYSGACVHSHHEHSQHAEENKERNMGLVWFYMMICATLISLCAVWGILFIPKATRPSYNRVIQFLMALAAGTMAGDGLLHLLPHAMMPPHDHGAHGGHEGHDHSGHNHGEHTHDDDDSAHTDSLLKGLVAVIGLYAFFFLERLFTIHRILIEKEKKEQGIEESTVKMLPTLETDDLKTVLSAVEVNGMVNKHHLESHSHSHSYSVIDAEDNKSKCPKLTALALMIILGDLFHNFCDGLAMGAAFSSSTTLGLSTSIAVFCHELPHEIGDFAVLIQSGLTKKEAVFFNFVSALSCYLGCIIGIFLGNLGNANLWIFAGVGGMFLYIALVDLIPEMTQAYITWMDEWKIYLSLHAAGLFLGTLFMFIIGLYEHDLQFILD